MTDYKIEAGIELPAKRGGGGSKKRVFYPFAKLKQGQSFFVPVEGYKNEKSLQQSVTKAWNDFRIERGAEQLNFTSRLVFGRDADGKETGVVEGVRVWRLKDRTPEEVAAAKASSARRSEARRAVAAEGAATA